MRNIVQTLEPVDQAITQGFQSRLLFLVEVTRLTVNGRKLTLKLGIFSRPERPLLVKADVRYWVTGNFASERLLYAPKRTLG